MKKYFFPTFLISILLACCFMCIWLVVSLHRHNNLIGKKLVIENDSLEIVSYSFLWDTFTLSNGAEVKASTIVNTKTSLLK